MTDETLSELQQAVILRAFDILDLHASIDEKYGELNRAVRTLGSVEREYFTLGLWAAYSAATMTFVDRHLIRAEEL